MKLVVISVMIPCRNCYFYLVSSDMLVASYELFVIITLITILILSAMKTSPPK
jgi:hypothetical protein